MKRLIIASNSWRNYTNTQENRTKLKKQIEEYTSTHRNPTAEDRKLVSEMRSKYNSMLKESMDKSKAASRASLAKYNEKSKLQDQLDKANKEYYSLYKHDEDNIPGRDRRLNELEKQINELEQKLSKFENVSSSDRISQAGCKEERKAKQMKRLVRASYSPWKTRYSVHWISPDGRDCLLGGSNSLSEANRIAKEQADEIFESPWETDERKFRFLENMYILDNETESDDNMSFETEEYIDNLMSEIHSRIPRNFLK